MKKLAIFYITFICVLLAGCQISGVEPSIKGSNSQSSKERSVIKTFDKYPGIKFEVSASITKHLQEKRKRSDSTTYLTSREENIISFANQLKNKALSENKQPVQYIIEFVQKLDYEHDYQTGYDDFPKYPEETIFTNNGDCEDTSYVMYSLLEALGYDVVLLLFPGHMMAAIACEEAVNGLCGGGYYEYNHKKYYPIETTGEGWVIGQLPEEFKKSSPQIIKNEGTNNFISLKCSQESFPRNEERDLMLSKSIRDTPQWSLFNNPFGFGETYTDFDVSICNMDNQGGKFNYRIIINSNRIGRTEIANKEEYLESAKCYRATERYDSESGEQFSYELIVTPSKVSSITYDLVTKCN